VFIGQLIRRELLIIGEVLLDYVQTSNNNVFPTSLDFLDKKEYGKQITERLKDRHCPPGIRIVSLIIECLYRDGSLRFVELSRIHYVWIGKEKYDFVHQFYAPRTAYCLKKLYGDFRPSTRYPDLTRKGMPYGRVILLTYEKRRIWGKDWAYVAFLDGHVQKYPVEDVKRMTVLQNAYFRLAVDASNTDTLVEALHDEKSDFRFRSAEALARLSMSEGRAFLEENFQNSDIFLKARSADALARLGDNKAFEYLNDVYRKSDDECLRVFAKASLDEIAIDAETEGL
jgi:prepilin-type processing-associated H-X9-DG protein